VHSAAAAAAAVMRVTLTRSEAMGKMSAPSFQRKIRQNAEKFEFQAEVGVSCRQQTTMVWSCQHLSLPPALPMVAVHHRQHFIGIQACRNASDTCELCDRE
jgi:hypothetical protein